MNTKEKFKFNGYSDNSVKENKRIEFRNTLSYTITEENGISLFQVEWDKNKSRNNRAKHGISFESAALVFADDNRIEYYDAVHSLDEERYIVIGLVHKVLFVVFTIRGETYRIISARIATAQERKIYYGK